MEYLEKNKISLGVGLWLILTTGFTTGFHFASENVTLVILLSTLFTCYRLRICSTKKKKLSLLLAWIYEEMGASLFVQQISLMYGLELISIILQLSPEDLLQRYMIAYLVHSLSFVYGLHHLPKWKLNYIHRYHFYSAIFEIANIVGLFSWITVPFLQFKLFGLTGPVIQPPPVHEMLNGSIFTAKNEDECLNYLSLNSGFLVRFFVLFVLQGLAYYKADLDNDNQIFVNDLSKMSRRFG